MRIYIIEDIRYGPMAAFIHKSSAEDAIKLDTNNLYSPSGHAPRILELEVEKRKRLFEYRKATINQ